MSGDARDARDPRPPGDRGAARKTRPVGDLDSGGPPALEVRGLAKSFGPTAVLRGLDLEVPAGTLTAVLGPSGCGKTTLLRLLAGFERPDAGAVRLGDRDLSGPGVHVAPERRRIGLVPQEGALFPHLSVAANIGFGLPRRRRAGRVAELLALLDLEGLGDRHPHQLSGGQQQRVALARALAPTPTVILLDEPFDALDAGLRSQVRAEVRAALRQTGTTGLIVTHDQEEALSLADRVAVMREGRIVQAGPPRELYAAPADLGVALFLGDAVVLDAEVGEGRATTALGRLVIAALPEVGLGAAGPPPAIGPAVAVLRPEQLRCVPIGSGRDGACGTVVGVDYYGHDGTATVRLDPSGVEVAVRAAGHLLAAPGEQVEILVEGTATVFPRPPSGPSSGRVRT
jgi:iron(III) transport system ATP-binding protein